MMYVLRDGIVAEVVVILKNESKGKTIQPHVVSFISLYL